MTRRITIPEDHVALILPAQLADELTSLMREQRRTNRRGYESVERWNRDRSGSAVEPKPLDEDSHAAYKVAGDILLALLEAKEA